MQANGLKDIFIIAYKTPAVALKPWWPSTWRT